MRLLLVPLLLLCCVNGHADTPAGSTLQKISQTGTINLGWDGSGTAPLNPIAGTSAATPQAAGVAGITPNVDEAAFTGYVEHNGRFHNLLAEMAGSDVVRRQVERAAGALLPVGRWRGAAAAGQRGGDQPGGHQH